MDCIFCKIIAGEVPCYTVYEDEFVKAVMDINPNSNGHILIMPKKHFTDFMDIDAETLGHIHDAAKIVKEIQYKTFSPDGLSLHVNYGIYQAVKHYHLHLIPVYKEKREIITPGQSYNLLMQSKANMY